MEYLTPMQRDAVARRRRLAVPFLILVLAATPILSAQSLKGSRSSLLRQNEAAREHDFTYLRTSSGVHEFAERGLLVRLPGNSDYVLASGSKGSVSFPYARPEVKMFVERLGDQYHSACGERLVVTSLTRPISRQPANASHLSVHPTGMAADLRRSSRASCRRWLEETLLYLEGRQVLEATREQHPPHYHVTLFPDPYMRYIGKEQNIQITRATSSRSSKSKTVLASSRSRKVRIGRGDTLWDLARRHGVSVSRLKQANGLRSSRVKAGQYLAIPSR
jgi:uncharacterized protein DUF5715/LysM domain-containing protein